MSFLSLIEAKRDGAALSSSAIHDFVRDYTAGTLPDYQMAALLMAIYFRGLNGAETRALTAAMRDSGEVLRFPDDPRPLVDKHSTGGIGDKVSLPLAPLLACLGFRVPMISGRGLGITGGTLDKLESIPGFRTRLEPHEIIAQVQQVGCAICGQTERMCPADRSIYALRDATGTVPSIPLITASILAKKLSEGIAALVLDVKFGAAAFMQTREEARELARTMAGIAREAGVQCRALLTHMDTPIGSAGNWLEVKESVACLDGCGPQDLRELVVECAAQLRVLTGREDNIESARDAATRMLDSGEPRRKWNEMLLAQGADLAAFEAMLNENHRAPVVVEYAADRDGFVSACNARLVGEVVRDLGGGRMTRESPIDHDVGLDLPAAIGAQVRRGATLCRIHARRREDAGRALERLQKGAFEISANPVTPSPRIVEVI